MSETAGYYLMLFNMLHFMNSRCWRSFYELSDPLKDFTEQTLIILVDSPHVLCPFGKFKILAVYRFVNPFWNQK
jgi:hypothetical protein